MTSKWRVIKKAVSRFYDYVGIEFDMLFGEMLGVRLNMNETNVRKRSTPQFEAYENMSWYLIDNKEAPQLMKEFNWIRKKSGLYIIDEKDVLTLLYRIDKL